MPTSSYSEYKDQETGQSIALPQLFPHASAIDMSKTELEGWISTGAIPQELYDADMQNQKKMEEISTKLKNGEQVQFSELPTKPWALTEYLLKNKARLYGENILKKVFSNLHDNDPDIVWLSFVKEAMLSITATDPLPIHFYTARKILKDKYEIEDSKAVDILARELLDHCSNICLFKSFHHLAFNKNPIDLKDLSDHLKDEKKETLQLDAEFIDYLKRIGPKGKKLSGEVEKNSKELFKLYEDNKFSTEYRRDVWGLWVTNNEYFNAILVLISQVIWEDKCHSIWNRETKGFPSLVKPVLDRLIPILGPKKTKKFIEKGDQIICYDQRGEPLLLAPAVDVNMISAFQKGVKELGTLTGHKMLRWQVNAGFERWAQGFKDPRLIEIDGGYSRIAELTGCNSTHDIGRIKEILNVQAHGRFIFPDGSQGNMLTLRVTDRYQNKEPSKISIVLGDMLLPAYVCQLQRSERRLIPIGDLPPLHGSPNTHAFQAQLQLLVFSEFSNQSDRLSEEGSVLITIEKWKQMAAEAGLNPEKIEAVISHWSQPDLFNCFLEKQGDEYRLASYYDKAQKFLEVQGQIRKTNSERGKRSAEKKKRKEK